MVLRMGVHPRITDGLLAAAVRRWPAHRREELAREWGAELHELAHEPGVPPRLRAWRRLWFAASLAVARPSGAPPRLSRRARDHVLRLLLAPPACLLVTALLLVPLGLLPFGWIDSSPVFDACYRLWEYLVLAAVSGATGVQLGQWLLRSRGGDAAGPGRAAAATLPAVGGLLLFDALAHGGQPTWWGAWAAAGLLVLLPPAARVTAELAGRGRLRATWAGAAVAAPLLALVAVDVIGVVAGSASVGAVVGPWWLSEHLGQAGLGLLVPRGEPGSAGSALAVLPRAVFATAILVLAHAVRVARPLPLWQRRKVTTPAGRSLTRNPWWHRILLAGAVSSLIAWAVTLAYLTPNIGDQTSWESRGSGLLPVVPAGWPGWTWEEGRLWMQELQLLGIACTALCFLLALARLGRPVWPTLAGAAALLAVDLTVVHEDWAVPALLPWLVAGGLLLGTAAWSVSIRLGPLPEHRSRRLVVTAVLLAAFLLPYPFFARGYADGRAARPILLLVVAGLAVVLAGLVAIGVRATTLRPVRALAWRTAIGPALMAIGVGLTHLGLLPGLDDPRHWSFLLLSPGPDRSWWTVLPALTPALALPAVLWTAAAIRGEPVSAGAAARHLARLPALFVGGFCVAWMTVFSAKLMAEFALSSIDYNGTHHALVYLPGALPVGLLVASVAAARLARHGGGGSAEPDLQGTLELDSGAM